VDLGTSEIDRVREHPLVRDSLGRAYFILDAAAMEQGRIADICHWQDALTIFEELGDLWQQAEVLLNAGAYLYYQGRWDEATDLWERSRELRMKTGDVVEAVTASNNIAEIRSDQGRLEEAEKLFREGLRVKKAAGHQESIAFALSNLGRVAYRSGRHTDAMELLRQGRALFAEVGNRTNVLEAEARIAECHLYMGDWQSALSATVSVEQRARAQGVVVQDALVHRIRGYALAQAGRLAEARGALEHSLRLARDRSAEHEVGLTLHALAELALLEGRHDLIVAEERDAIFERLGVVSVSEVPLPKVRVPDTQPETVGG
jgi:tetratricopeptide (TPR) repeat protein